MKKKILYTPTKNLLCEHTHTAILSLLFYFICGISFNSQAQQSTTVDSAKINALYQEIIKKTKCTNDLTSEAFYALLQSYTAPSYSYSYFPSSSSSTSSYSNSYSSTSHHHYHQDTVFLTEYIIQKDTFLMYQDVPNQEEVKAAHTILTKILEDKDLTDLIREAVKDMSAEEVKEFRKDIQENVKEMNNQLKQEQNNKLVAELEAKRLQWQLAQEAKKATKEEERGAWDTLSKVERKELIKAKVAIMAHDVGNGLKTAGAAVGLSLAVIGGVIAKGIIAIGKGIVNAAKAVWNWLDDHFYIRIDLSCAAQRKFKQNRRYLSIINKQRSIQHYKGNCPSW